MKNNRKRHRLLKILANKRIKGQQENRIGVSWEDLTSEMKCSLDELQEISAPLFDEKEIEVYTFYLVGACATTKGVSSYATEKYIRENTRQIFEGAKNWVQTIIPVLSLIIALYAINDSKTKDNEINKYKIRLENLEKEVINIDKRTSPTIDSVDKKLKNK